MNNGALEFTGERLMTEIEEYWTLEHLHRYAIATEYIKDKTVIDIASGEGYGSFLLAKSALKVIGVDISPEAVNHSTKKYLKDNLIFKTGSATDIPMENNSIDVIVSFETIEHLEDHERMMHELKRVLKPNGILIISSPDKKYYSDIPAYSNPFHLKELYRDEFEELLQNHFSNTIFLSQKSFVGSVIVKSDNSGEYFTEFTGDFNEIKGTNHLCTPLYHICVASNEMLGKELNSISSIFSNEELTEKYFHSFMRIQELNQNILQLENRIDLYKSQINHPIIRLLRILRRPFK